MRRGPGGTAAEAARTSVLPEAAGAAKEPKEEHGSVAAAATGDFVLVEQEDDDEFDFDFEAVEALSLSLAAEADDGQNTTLDITEFIPKSLAAAWDPHKKRRDESLAWLKSYARQAKNAQLDIEDLCKVLTADLNEKLQAYRHTNGKRTLVCCKLFEQGIATFELHPARGGHHSNTVGALAVCDEEFNKIYLSKEVPIEEKIKWANRVLYKSVVGEIIGRWREAEYAGTRYALRPRRLPEKEAAPAAAAPPGGSAGGGEEEGGGPRGRREEVVGLAVAYRDEGGLDQDVALRVAW